jgi:ribonuclease BN (tRNA processing enzyme)
VTHLLHEAWSCSTNPVADAGDATAAEAGRVAHDARVQLLTLVHPNPLLERDDELLADARTSAHAVRLGRDGALLQHDRAG